MGLVLIPAAGRGIQDRLASSVRNPSSMRLTRVLVQLLALALPAWAGTAEGQGLGYGVAGLAGISGFFGSSASSIHVAGGGEVLAGGRAGVGGEIGILGNSSSALVTLSANGVLHLSTAARRPSPFITGGYSLFGLQYGEGSFSAWNIGGGVDLWPGDRVGIRLDFRDHVRPDRRGAVQYWTIRAGVVFR